MANIDEKIDITIADPPYGQLRLINESISATLKITNGPSFFFMYAEDLVGLKHKPDQILFWVKTASTKNTVNKYSRFVEVIAVFNLKWSPFNQDTHWTTRSGTFIDQLTYRKHEYQKPTSLIEKLLVVNSNYNDTVLDPFAGSGSVKTAAILTERNSISIEIDQKLAQVPIYNHSWDHETDD